MYWQERSNMWTIDPPNESPDCWRDYGCTGCWGKVGINPVKQWCIRLKRDLYWIPSYEESQMKLIKAEVERTKLESELSEPVISPDAINKLFEAIRVLRTEQGELETRISNLSKYVANKILGQPTKEAEIKTKGIDVWEVKKQE